jgi:large subunit ribosomal protein L19
MNVESLVTAKRNPKIPEIFPGDMVKVSAKIVEGGRERIQVFQGVVIGIKRNGIASTFTVRHVFQGIGVERTFPFNSPRVDKVEVAQGGKVRRAKLYYLRGLSGKAARKKVKRVEGTGRRTAFEPEFAEEPALAPEEEPVMMEPEAAATEPEAKAEVETEKAAAAEDAAEEPATMEKAPEEAAEQEQPEEAAESAGAEEESK